MWARISASCRFLTSSSLSSFFLTSISCRLDSLKTSGARTSSTSNASSSGSGSCLLEVARPRARASRRARQRRQHVGVNKLRSLNVAELAFHLASLDWHSGSYKSAFDRLAQWHIRRQIPRMPPKRADRLASTHPIAIAIAIAIPFTIYCILYTSYPIDQLSCSRKPKMSESVNYSVMLCSSARQIILNESPVSFEFAPVLRLNSYGWNFPQHSNRNIQFLPRAMAANAHTLQTPASTTPSKTKKTLWLEEFL